MWVGGWWIGTCVFALAFGWQVQELANYWLSQVAKLWPRLREARLVHPVLHVLAICHPARVASDDVTYVCTTLRNPVQKCSEENGRIC